MTLVVLVILAVVWAIYLVSWLRSRSETRSVNSISSFSRHLSVLERTAPGTRQGADFGAARSRAGLAPSSAVGVVRRPTLSPAKKRRRDILFGLAAATGVTALGAWLMGGVFSVVFVVTLGLTVAYVVLLAQTQRRAVEAREKVRYLDGADGRVDSGAWADDADGTFGTAHVRDRRAGAAVRHHPPLRQRHLGGRPPPLSSGRLGSRWSVRQARPDVPVSPWPEGPARVDVDDRVCPADPRGVVVLSWRTRPRGPWRPSRHSAGVAAGVAVLWP